MPVFISKRLLNVNQAAEYLSIGRSKLYQWVRKGAIPSITLDSRRLFDVEDLDKFVERLKQGQKCS
ncbi:helix-turn-helix domain-containing protein [candidate division KSB1 bacterium]|nr:helix-turn-helix domain-containing protein [candidate division KSB1 bacterium]